MSRSPRKALRQAAHALDQFFEVIDEHPDARQDVIVKVGDEGLHDLEQIRESLQRLANQVDGAPGN